MYIFYEETQFRWPSWTPSWISQNAQRCRTGTRWNLKKQCFPFQKIPKHLLYTSMPRSFGYLPDYNYNAKEHTLNVDIHNFLSQNTYYKFLIKPYLLKILLNQNWRHLNIFLSSTAPIVTSRWRQPLQCPLSVALATVCQSTCGLSLETWSSWPFRGHCRGMDSLCLTQVIPFTCTWSIVVAWLFGVMGTILYKPVLDRFFLFHTY